MPKTSDMRESKFLKLERFISPEPNTGCWFWTGALREGYGLYSERVNGKTRSQNAHRAVYRALVGEIPSALQLDHLCRVRCCVNPDHLEPVTQRENILRGQGVAAEHAKRTTCKNGHQLVWDGWQRRCLPCIYARRAQRKAEVSAQN
jgi:hypothetical protein